MFRYIDKITRGLATQVLKSHPKARNALLLLDDYVLIASEAATDMDVSRAYSRYLELLRTQRQLLLKRYREDPSQHNKLMLDASTHGLRESSKLFISRSTKVIRIDNEMGYIHRTEFRFEDMMDPDTARAIGPVYDVVLAWLAREGKEETGRSR